HRAPPLTSTLSLHDALPISFPRRQGLQGVAIQPLPHREGVGDFPVLRGFRFHLQQLGMPVLEAEIPGESLEKSNASQGYPQHFLDRKSTRLNSSHVKISYAV